MQLPDHGNWVKIILVDYRTPFNPMSVPVPNIDLSLEEREAHGLGLFFIRQWMDEFGYETDGDNGNWKLWLISMKNYPKLKISNQEFKGGSGNIWKVGWKASL